MTRWNGWEAASFDFSFVYLCYCFVFEWVSEWKCDSWLFVLVLLAPAGRDSNWARFAGFLTLSLRAEKMREIFGERAKLSALCEASYEYMCECDKKLETTKCNCGCVGSHFAIENNERE